MTGYLLDTNVISEITRPVPNKQVMEFLDTLVDGYVSVVTVHELAYGLERLAPGERRKALAEAIEQFLSIYGDRVLGIGVREARAAASLRAGQAERGRTLHLADALIAGTALIHGLAVATHNVSDFSGLGMQIHDPWEL